MVVTLSRCCIPRLIEPCYLIFGVCGIFNYPQHSASICTSLIPILPNDLRLFYVLDSFSGQLWPAQDGPEIVPSGEIAEDAVPDLLVYHKTKEYVCNSLLSFPTWTGWADDVWYLSSKV